MQHGPQRLPFLEAISVAREVAAEDPQRLIRVSHPFPLWISAGAYLDKYGPGDRYDVLRFIERLTIPVLFSYGELELDRPTDAFIDVEPKLRPLCVTKQRQLKVIPRANHFYAHGAVPLGDAVVSFLEEIATGFGG